VVICSSSSAPSPCCPPPGQPPQVCSSPTVSRRGMASAGPTSTCRGAGSTCTARTRANLHVAREGSGGHQVAVRHPSSLSSPPHLRLVQAAYRIRPPYTVVHLPRRRYCSGHRAGQAELAQSGGGGRRRRGARRGHRLGQREIDDLSAERREGRRTARACAARSVDQSAVCRRSLTGLASVYFSKAHARSECCSDGGGGT
jgi:hypothetical protein